MSKLDPCFLSAAEAANQIESGSLTSEALVRSCLGRISVRDDAVKAWLHIDAEAAIRAAREADKRPHRSRLHGLPIGVKDNIDTKNFFTTYNSAHWHGYLARRGLGRRPNSRDPKVRAHEADQAPGVATRERPHSSLLQAAAKRLPLLVLS
jgi:hypothetical protein